MPDHTIESLSRLKWMHSRIPATDGLVTFVPKGVKDPAIDAFALNRRSRFYPLKGGTRILVPYQPPIDYDAAKWHIEKGAWDHEHCDFCREHIPSMTLCWVTEVDPYVLLCKACHSKVAAASSPPYRKLLSRLAKLLRRDPKHHA